jgi:hypothetical protein
LQLLERRRDAHAFFQAQQFQVALAVAVLGRHQPARSGDNAGSRHGFPYPVNETSGPACGPLRIADPVCRNRLSPRPNRPMRPPTVSPMAPFPHHFSSR